MAYPLCFLLLYLFFTRLMTAALKYNKKRSHGCQPVPFVGQKGDILGIGELLKWFRTFKADSVNMSLQQMFEKVAATFEIVVGGKLRVYSIDPRNLAVVWNSSSREWGLEGARAFAMEPFVGPGIMSSDGAFWEHSRALIKPIFARNRLEYIHLALEVHVQNLLAHVPRDGTTVDMQSLFGLYGLDTTTEFLFGESLGTLAKDGAGLEAKNFLESYNYGQRGIGMRMQMPPYNFLTRDPKFWQSCHTAHAFVERYVDRALEEVSRPARRNKSVSDKKTQSNEPYVFAYELAKQTVDRRDIRNQLLNIFLPGHDAISVVLTNLVFILARHPRVWAKLRAELNEQELLQAPVHQLTLDRLRQLPYLEQTINEILRLHPTIGVISRAALRDTVLPAGGGPDGESPVFVPKGAIFSTHVYALHRRRDIYGQAATEFHPERWATLRPSHYEFLPFGRGPRHCPAEKFSTAQVYYTLVRFLQTFSAVENRDPVLEFVEQYKISTESKNGAKVAFVPAQ